MIAPVGDYGKVVSGPEVVLDLVVSLAYLAEVQCDVAYVVNAVKVAVSDAINATDTSAMIEAATLAEVAAAVPGIDAVFFASIEGSSSYQGIGGAAYFVTPNAVLVDDVRIEYV